jgi:hypothetical protein
MDTTVKDCTTCQNHVGKKTLDDIPDICFPCVYSQAKTGYYTNWTPIVNQDVTPEEEEEWRHLDMVNSPKHYTKGGIETIDFILAKLGRDGTVAYCMGNVMKYTTRWKDKNGIEDLKKAQWYLKFAITLMDNK